MNSFLQDGNGDNSSTRLMGVMVWFCVMAAWLFVSVSHGALADIPETVLGALTIASGWLAFNKHTEVNAPAATEVK